MQNFYYRAINSHGKSIKGHIKAESEKQAKQTLKKQELIIISIRPEKDKLFDLQRKIKNQDVCLFTRQLATMLSAGIPLNEALHGIYQEQSQPQFKQLIQTIYQKVLEGFSLAQALKQHPKTFNHLYCTTVHAGEQSGQLDKILNQLADYIEQQHLAQQKIQQALIYPALMMVVAILIIFFLMTQVVPKILSIFDDNQQALPLMTKILLTISHAFSVMILPLFTILLIFTVWFLKKKQEPYWQRLFDSKLLQISLYQQFVKMTQIPRYLHTMRILLISGVNILESMYVASELLSNIIIREKFKEATQSVKEGTAISIALNKTGWFSNMTIYLLQSGEKTGQLGQMMERAAQQIDTERLQKTETALKLLEPIIILLMGGFVLFIVLAILLPIFQMQQLV